MTRANLIKASIVLAVGGILALIVAAPLVGAKNNHDAPQKQNAQKVQGQLTDPTTNPVEPTTPSSPDPGFHWASVATNNGTPTVRNASDSSTTVTSDTGTQGAYTVAFPTTVHVLGCTATPNNGTQSGTSGATQGTVSCGLGDDTGLQPNQVQVLTTSGNSTPSQGSNFTVVGYDAPSATTPQSTANKVR
jgi:hypothetical protein